MSEFEDTQAILENLDIGSLKAEKKKQLREDFEDAARRTPKKRKISFEEPLETINEEDPLWIDDDADAVTLSSTTLKEKNACCLGEFSNPKEERRSEPADSWMKSVMAQYLEPVNVSRSTKWSTKRACLPSLWFKLIFVLVTYNGNCVTNSKNVSMPSLFTLKHYVSQLIKSSLLI